MMMKKEGRKAAFFNAVSVKDFFTFLFSFIPSMLSVDSATKLNFLFVHWQGSRFFPGSALGFTAAVTVAP